MYRAKVEIYFMLWLKNQKVLKPLVLNQIQWHMPVISEAEAGGLPQVRGQAGPHSKFSASLDNTAQA